MKKQMLSLVILLLITFSVSAQFGAYKMVISSGNLKALKGVTELQVEYDYQGMKVGDMDEEDYIKKHMADMEKIKPGSSADWKVKWVEDRKNKFQPNFEKYFSAGLKKIKMTAGPNVQGAKYKLIIKTIKTEPGLYTGVSVVAKDTYIDVDAILVENSDPDTQLCVIRCTRFVGDAGDFASYDVSLRIMMSYSNLGKKLSGFIIKTLKSYK